MFIEIQNKIRRTKVWRIDRLLAQPSHNKPAAFNYVGFDLVACLVSVLLSIAFYLLLKLVLLTLDGNPE